MTKTKNTPEPLDFAAMMKTIATMSEILSTHDKQHFANLESMYNENTPREAKSAATDSAGQVLNDLGEFETTLIELNQNFQNLKNHSQKIVDEQRRQLEIEINKLNNVNKPLSWADEVDDDVPSTETPWTEVVKKIIKPVPSKAAKSAPKREFSVEECVYDKQRWVKITIPIESVNIHPDGMATDLMVVENNKQFKALPAGMLVYNYGERIPKLMMTTGCEHGPAVPLNCRMWDPADNETRIKYSKFNHKIESDNASNCGQFYIDRKAAKITKLPEDDYRCFRNTSRVARDNDNVGRIWTGYYVYRFPNFGDGKYLDEQVNKVGLDEPADLYQYSLWMMLVSMIHHQVKNY